MKDINLKMFYIYFVLRGKFAMQRKSQLDARPSRAAYADRHRFGQRSDVDIEIRRQCMQTIRWHAQVFRHTATRGNAEQSMLGTTIAVAGAALMAFSTRRERFERDIRSVCEGHAFTNGVDHARHFVTGLQSGDFPQHAAEDVQVASADPHCGDSDTHPTCGGLGHFAVDDVQLSATGVHRCFHRGPRMKKAMGPGCRTC